MYVYLVLVLVLVLGTKFHIAYYLLIFSLKRYLQIQSLHSHILLHYSHFFLIQPKSLCAKFLEFQIIKFQGYLVPSLVSLLLIFGVEEAAEIKTTALNPLEKNFSQNA